MMHSAEVGLREGLQALNLGLNDQQVAQLIAYLALLQKWNRVYNLTAVRNPDEMLTHHVLDSLAVITPLRRELGAMFVPPVRHEWSLLDCGSGAGLPGVIVAICCPDAVVTCVDAVAKKVAFVQQVATELKLANLRGLHARVESVSGPFDVVCSRAFASLKDFTTWSRTAIAQHGLWLAMKGKVPEAELAELPSGVKMFHVERLDVPGLQADRCIVWLRPGEAASVA